jgi:hypothetical protein
VSSHHKLMHRICEWFATASGAGFSSFRASLREGEAASA